MTFEVISGPNDGDTGTDTTDSSGEAEFTYTGGGQGTDVIQACYEDDPGSGVFVCSQTVTKVWNEATTYLIELSPEYELNLVGESHEVTATVTYGDPVSGIDVTFEVISGPNTGTTDTVTTNGDGEARFNYDGTGGVGTDKIQACIEVNGDEICSSAVDKEWTEETISITPLLDTNPLDTDHTVTATVQNLKGTPLSGIDVTFSIRQGPNDDEPDYTAATDSNGQVDYTYTGDGGSGTDVIRACFTNAAGDPVCTDYGETFDNDAFKEWQEDDNRVCPSIVPQPAELPNAVIGEFYSQQFTGFGGNGTYTFTITGGSLPADLSFTPEGLLSGDLEEEGTFTFTITATDDNNTPTEDDDCSGSREYTLVVCPGITLSPGTENLPNGYLNQFYSTTITESSPVDTWSRSGDLPPGLNGSPGSYIISGTPTEPGSWTFTLTASTEQGCTVSRQYTIRILAEIPTLTEWGMVVMALVLAGFTIVIMRRRQTV